jgi:DNA repair exonuclease SbcCD ATPase subunit
MSKKIRIRVKRPWIAYPGSTLQQNYAEAREHGYLLWDIKSNADFDVNFCELPNPKPFITLEWQGSLKTTLGLAADYPKGSRFRIKSDLHIVQKDISALTKRLKREFNATEVTFRQEHKASTETLDTGTTKLIREDLRNPEVLMILLKDYYKDVKVSPEEWEVVTELVSSYVLNVASDKIMRGSKWSLRELKFDNVFNYGEKNVIDFSKLEGIVGIFGPNRSGKSSIVGTIMYALFNTSDRGSVKNKDICNTRKAYCYSRAIVTIGGTTYVIERQTAKQETKFGEIYAPTSLNLFRIDGKKAVDLGGLQRNDTEKFIRNILGTADDFTLTSLSAQGDVNQYIQHGSTKRRQALSRFLDLDVCNQIFDQAKQDVNASKAVLKQLPDRDWPLLIKENEDHILKHDEELYTLGLRSRQLRNELTNVRSELMGLNGRVPVTEAQIEDQRKRVTHLLSQVETKQVRLKSEHADIKDFEDKLRRVKGVLNEHDLDMFKKQYSAYQQLKSSVRALKATFDKENEKLKRQQRSLKILDEVPCGDQFPTCKFIKDAHDTLGEVDEQGERVFNAQRNLAKAQEALNAFSIDEVLNKIDKLEQLVTLRASTKLKISQLTTDTVRLESELNSSLESLEESRARLLEFEEAQRNEENESAVRLRHEMERLEGELSTVDNDKLSEASSKGRHQSRLEQLEQERTARRAALQKMKAYEIVYGGFCKKGIPNLIVASQLPVINAEMMRILNGIVDYTVEMETEGDNDRIEIYINYGDSRRPIELGSGMEKFMASVAMRVAMVNISTLPKPDMFIIDEGFGSLDDLSIEACNRLLISLKRYFRTIVVITHVDAIKDTADHVIEITKNEMDAHVEYI